MEVVKQKTTLALRSAPAPKSATSLVLNTPELLMMIFISSLPEDGEPALSDGPTLEVDSHVRYDDELSTIMYVSDYWKSVALATPQLWARLDLKLGYYSRSSVELDRLSFHLKQSRSVPISVRVSRCRTYKHDPIFLQYVVNTLFKHAHRWENINLDLPLDVDLPWNDGVGCDFPHLKSLKISFGSNEEIPRVLPLSRRLRIRSAPKLRALVVPNMLLNGIPSNVRSLGYSDMTMHVQSHNSCKLLTELVLKDVHVSREDICRLPIAFPLLENLVLTSLKRRREPNVPHLQTTTMDIDEVPSECFLDNLTILKVEGEGYSWPLRLIIAPVLTKLTVIDNAKETDGGMDYFDAEVLRFLIRSKAPIVSFTYVIGREFLSHRNLKDLLEHIPELEYLSMYNPKLCRADLLILHDPSVAPKLTTIRTVGEIISDSHIVRISDETDEVAYEDIFELIKARCRQHGEEGSADTKNRKWLKQLEFPLHKQYEKRLRRDPIFQNADVKFVNTHECSDVGDCGRLIPGVLTHRGIPKFYEGKREW